MDERQIRLPDSSAVFLMRLGTDTRGRTVCSIDWLHGSGNILKGDRAQILRHRWDRNLTSVDDAIEALEAALAIWKSRRNDSVSGSDS